jgi:hypothetical protein
MVADPSDSSLTDENAVATMTRVIRLDRPALIPPNGNEPSPHRQLAEVTWSLISGPFGSTARIEHVPPPSVVGQAISSVGSAAHRQRFWNASMIAMIARANAD